MRGQVTRHTQVVSAEPITADEIQDVIKLALAYWNDHRQPYQWRKVPAVLPTTPPRGYGSALIPYAMQADTYRENHLELAPPAPSQWHLASCGSPGCSAPCCRPG
jgi:hypothetical protein